MDDYLPSILENEDHNSMASSIESRLPFLDHRVVEFARGLPPDYLCRGGWTKAILRRALEGLVPQVVLRRPLKLGLPGPLDGSLPAAIDAAAAARRRLIADGWIPASLLPEIDSTTSPRAATRLRVLDAWTRTCLDAPAPAGVTPSNLESAASALG
jgi:asparagine synthetase B (glutamine-hydrolysing)